MQPEIEGGEISGCFCTRTALYLAATTTTEMKVEEKRVERGGGGRADYCFRHRRNVKYEGQLFATSPSSSSRFLLWTFAGVITVLGAGEDEGVQLRLESAMRKPFYARSERATLGSTSKRSSHTKSAKGNINTTTQGKYGH